ncbi:hypothetical protein LY90DRAFT_704294 [Neocallimastix californiae]|uniref:Uncharacterized protein n=1 Tax=Neocallimastix californiae TaxID=1754190 RepID=A0A1Y2BXF3_9FUNG|nr:hypothetical protein LY90DRAFT_704294 [Neocallimastix californiae]|eukprot:ORY39449.1 hypothetical protein LY90DRAFT_704294 [Neocallimastix californiae]
MVSTIILFILLIKLISLKGFFIFLTFYSVMFFVKFLNDESLFAYQMQMNKPSENDKNKLYTEFKGDYEPTKDTISDMKVSSEPKEVKDDIYIKNKNQFIKSTVTIKKIIVKKTLSSSKDVLIIKKSKNYENKKIVTIKHALI